MTAFSAGKLPSEQRSANNMTKLKVLRAEGEQMHRDGKHAESMPAPAKARKLLGM